MKNYYNNNLYKDRKSFHYDLISEKQLYKLVEEILEEVKNILTFLKERKFDYYE